MKLSIPTQLCGLVITIILLFFFLMQRKMNIKRDKHFLRCIIVTFIVLSFDILATTLNTYIPDDGFFTVYANRFYLVSTTVVVYAAILYIAGEVYSRKIYNIISYCVIGFGLIMSFFIFNPYITTNVITSKDNGLVIYTEGSATILTFSTAFLGIVLIMIGSYMYEKVLGKKQAIAIRLWMIIWTTFAVLQYFRKEMLICSFAISLGLLIMYIALEALDSNVDRVSGLFNWNGYLRYVEERKKDRLPCQIIYLKALDSIRMLDEKTITKALLDFNKILLKRKDIISFRIQNNEYLIILKANASIEVLHHDYLKYKHAFPIITSNYYPFYLYDSTIIENQSDLSSLIDGCFQKGNKLNKDFLEISTKMIKDFKKDVLIQSYIEQAIHHEELVVVYYQPIFNLNTNKYSCAEALVRLKRTDGTLIPPGEFIALAEKNGMIHKLDEIVFDKVCKFIKKNNMEDLGLDYIESNLSVAQLCDKDLSEKYINIIKNNNIDCKYVNLEITESAQLDHRNTLSKNLTELRGFGVEFSLDDYGTGYSNLNYVVDMPVKIVKFDKVMVDSYFEACNSQEEFSKRAKISIESSINMFRTIGLEIVCEGVEKEEQEEVLKGMNVNFIQGFLHSKPLPESEFINFLKSNNN